VRTARLAAVLMVVVCLLPAADLNVVVRDPHGHIVRNLEPADFQLLEDGEMSLVKDATLVDDPRKERLITLLFGPIQNDVAPVVRTAAEDLIAAVRKSTVRIAVYQVDQSLTLLQTFAADQKALKSAVGVATGTRRSRGAEPIPPGGDQDLAAIAEQAVKTAAGVMSETSVRPSLAALIALSREQAKIPGRKAILYFSNGLPVANADDAVFQNVVSAANRAGVAIYAVDADALAISDKEERLRNSSIELYNVGGRMNMPIGVTFNPEKPREKAPDRSSPVLRALSEETGGFSLASAGSLRSDLRRIREDLAAYYELSYESHTGKDGAFHNTQVGVNRPQFRVQGREGYFALPTLSTRLALPFEVPLLEALDHPAELPAFFHESAVMRLRQGDRPAQFVTMGVPAGQLEFQEDSSVGVLRGHLTLIAIVRDQAGQIVSNFGRDVPFQCSPGTCLGFKDRYLAFADEFHLAPGSYTLESAMRDEVSGRTSTRRSAFSVEPVTAELGISSLCLVKEIVPANDTDLDAPALRVGHRAIVPAVNGVVRAADGAAASLFYTVYPSKSATAPLALHLDVLKEGRPVLGGPVTGKPESWGTPQILSIDLKSLASGPYDLRLVASQGGERVESRTRMVVDGANAASPATTESTAEAVIRTPSPEELAAVAPSVDQQRLLADAREIVAHYSSRLPNFICTQVTRRMYDSSGRGKWRPTGEVASLVTFADGEEHYSILTDRTSRQQRDAAPGLRVTSAGEFGTHLKRIFDPEHQAHFGFVRQERLRGRRVQVFTYAVDGQHSKYQISFTDGQSRESVFSPYHGMVYVDYETGGVRKLTVETDPLPDGHPVRLVSVTLEYDDISVAGKLYLLPIAAQLDVQFPKRRIARNDITFRSYQRFGTSSRMASTGPAQSGE